MSESSSGKILAVSDSEVHRASMLRETAASLERERQIGQDLLRSEH